MGLLDDFLQAYARGIEAIKSVADRVDEFFDRILQPSVTDEQGTQELSQILEEVTPADEVAAAFLDVVEEAIVSDLDQEGTITPENVERITDDVEGASMATLLAFGLAGSAVEAASLGQIDQQQEFLMQAITALQIDDVTGTELEARKTQGIAPAMEAKAAKEHRANFVNLQDAVELALRNKQADEGYLTPENAPPRVQELIGSDAPVNPDNLVEEWGIRDDNLPILEEVALEAMEFEELIETPAELGLVVDDDVLEQVLDLAGYPEALKDFLRQVPAEIPRSNRMWEERTAVEPLVDELETLAGDEEISPQAAVDLIPDEVEEAKPALADRFANLQDLPAGPPTRSLIEDSALRGLTDISTMEARLDRLEFDIDRYDDVVDVTILKEIDDDLQQAMALGFISEARYGALMDRVGLDDGAQQALMAGQGLDDVADRRLQERAIPREQSVASIVGIGEARATALAGAGIETVGDLAQADPEPVADTAQVSPETAQAFIDQAQQRIS